MDGLWYFAYGSNMCRTIFRERRGIEPLAARVGWLADHRLCFNIPVGPGEHGVANVEPAPGSRVCGVAYLLTAESCERLDRSEGVHVELYWREPVELLLADGERVAGYTTVRHGPARDGCRRRAGPAAQRRRRHGLPDDYVSLLRGFTLARDERGPG
jgi:cation transport regulator ChaC